MASRLTYSINYATIEFCPQPGEVFLRSAPFLGTVGMIFQIATETVLAIPHRPLQVNFVLQLTVWSIIGALLIQYTVPENADSRF